MEPLGSLREIRGQLGRFNIAPDGSGASGMGERVGTGVFHGPGLVAEVPLAEEPSTRGGEGPQISQILVTVTDEDFAFPVLIGLCRQFKWKLMDPDSGRSFG